MVNKNSDHIRVRCLHHHVRRSAAQSMEDVEDDSCVSSLLVAFRQHLICRASVTNNLSVTQSDVQISRGVKSLHSFISRISEKFSLGGTVAEKSQTSSSESSMDHHGGPFPERMKTVSTIFWCRVAIF